MHERNQAKIEKSVLLCAYDVPKLLFLLCVKRRQKQLFLIFIIIPIFIFIFISCPYFVVPIEMTESLLMQIVFLLVFSLWDFFL